VPNSTLSGKVAWITGGGSGIGLAGGIELARAGAHVVISGRSRETLLSSEKQIKAAGSGEAIALDVADQKEVAQAAQGILKRHGRVDILVNSAGINFAKRYWAETDSATFGEVVTIHLNGAAACTMAVLQGMRQRRQGTVINVASFAGWYLGYLTGPAYSASKAGMIALSHSFNIEECVNGLRATALCPGEAATPILKKRPVEPSAEEKARMLQEDDLGRTIRFIAEMPAHVCINELVITPVWNRLYLGGSDLKRA
jgi:NADP-dependent 3-hydroxy acid dehydrogenase YdfG